VKPDKADAAVVLHQEFASLTFARSEFPMLTDWGLEDYSETVHSFGMNYLAALGRQHGRWAVSEFPVPVSETIEALGVRLDAVWWSRPSRQIELLAEFERYQPNVTKLTVVQQKVRHLLLCHHHLPPSPRILLLVVWALSGKVPQRLDEVRALAGAGFRTADNVLVPGVGSQSRFMVATAVFAAVNGRLDLREVLL
jgi:hypothetical protein